jgi:chromosome segregation ATPase
MKNILLIFALALASCTSTTRKAPPPQQVPLPVKAEVANITPVNEGVGKVQQSVDRTYQSVQIIKTQLAAVSREAEGAKAAAQSAYERGVNAGSSEAAMLRDQVSRVASEVLAAKAERDMLDVEVDTAKKELKNVAGELNKVQIALAKMQSESDNLRANLTEANVRLETGAKQVVALQADVAKSQEVIDLKDKWMKRWMGAFLVLGALNAVYIAAKINGWGAISRF